MQVFVPDTGCNVPYDIRGVRGQIRYQKKQNKKKINRSVLLISDTCGQGRTLAVLMWFQQNDTGKDENEDERERRCMITAFRSRHMERLIGSSEPYFQSMG